MSDTFTTLEELQKTDNSLATLQQLTTVLTKEQNYHQLFDILLIQKKLELNLPLIHPTSFDDIPKDQRTNFEKHYIKSTQQIDNMLLKDNRIKNTWVYFQTIQKPNPVHKTLNKLSTNNKDYKRTEKLINITLYEGTHPIKNLELMLNSHNTYNTITALNQQIIQLPPDDHLTSAQLLINQLYNNLCHTLNTKITQQLPMIEPSENLHKLISKNRNWLFTKSNYHIDVSHLSTIVHFTHSLEPNNTELPQTLKLTEYNERLDEQFHYPNETPFNNFYATHGHFFRALLDDNHNEAIKYFQKQLKSEPNKEDKQIITYIIVDLLQQIGLINQTIELTITHLTNLDKSTKFNFAKFCQITKHLNLLQNTAHSNGNLVTWTKTLINNSANWFANGPTIPPPEPDFLHHNKTTWNQIIQKNSQFAHVTTNKKITKPLKMLDNRNWLPTTIENLDVLCLTANNG